MRRAALALAALLLATAPVGAAEPAGALAAESLRVRVSEIRIRGNTVLPDAVLAEVARPFSGRALSGADLETLRERLTRRYVEAGYVSSGVWLPDQDFAGGVLWLQVVEGRLARVEVKGDAGFAAGFLRRQLPVGDAPLDVHDLEERLQLLRRDPRIRALRATLRPGARVGESVLELDVEAARRLTARLEVDNHRSPALGGFGSSLHLAVDNLARSGDALGLSGALAEGLRDAELRYAAGLPLWRGMPTVVEAHGRISRFRVVEEVESLDIESDYRSAGFALRQPLVRRLRGGLELSAGLEVRESETRLGGAEFPFGEGRRRAVVLRLGQDALLRGERSVLALRSTVNVGLDVFGATANHGEDAGFTSWLAQLQALHRLPRGGVEVLLRGDLQLAFDQLPGFEQFGVGGRYSVRGFRQNARVRDSGAALGVEVRVPLLRAPDGRVRLACVPFVDGARAWGFGRDDEGSPATLVGAGVGLVWSPRRWLSAELFYGRDVLGLERPGERDLQDEGVHLRLVARAF